MTYLKPLPEISERNQPFWDGLKQRKFLLPKCEDCGCLNWVPYPACRQCLSSDQRWIEASGRAKLYSYTIVHRGPGAFGPEVPYVIAYAELDEGNDNQRPVIVMGNLIDCAHEAIEIGMPLDIAYEDIPDEDVTLYRFVPRS